MNIQWGAVGRNSISWYVLELARSSPAADLCQPFNSFPVRKVTQRNGTMNGKAMNGIEAKLMSFGRRRGEKHRKLLR